ncbi:malto-oligosyltrehalose trehalohydrolase [Trueperella bialowiezensis]|uniref:Malto-oligosyltrehalose trehalohydrolase n=1 Tax=Trueperella bialowiezensis TaxID=312285 RepID=A0A448PC24_9ACTO|nr:malto-oligosyltrehalose trehalohydrolase [Trueperella bialowiezensis]VEI12498.1 Malto-oligosyltrehalose trehalohydrolase [Trueperella bialowiezensis]
MTNVSIWAPNARTVSLVVGDNETALIRDGEHFVSPQPLPAGTRYQLKVDGGMALPDPRSMRQPEGPHGPSEIVDPASFSWTDGHWQGENLHGKVFYELHVGAFTREGTFRAAIDRLDYLRDLGVDVVQLMPIAPMPGQRGWGYDGVSIYAIHEPYGSPTDLVALVDGIHARGMSACLDVVYNHFGPDGNYLAQFAPYFSSAHHTPWGEALNLDGEHSEQVRRYLIDNAKQWLRDYHFDALRLDAVHHLLDDSPRHFLAQLSDEVAELGRQLGRTFTITAESEDNNPLLVTPTAEGGYGMDMQWADDVHHALHVWLTGESNAYYADYVDESAMAQAFEHGFVRVGQELTFPSAPRGKPIPESFSGHRFMVFDENHDQVGNRLISDRPSLKASLGQLAVSRALILLSHYTPMLFMGEEFATRKPFHYFTDHGPDLGQHILAGRLAEFADWDMTSIYGDIETRMYDPQDIQAFITSKLDWHEVGFGEHARMLDFVRQLIDLRDHPDIASGDRSATTMRVDGDGGWMRRGDTVIVFSRADEPLDVVAPIDGKEIVLSWDVPTVSGTTVSFGGASVAIFQ